jgi:pSer/pThr/pTyr-binding forkhead associated (FHA) protein
MLKLRFKNNNHNAVWLVEPKVTIGMAADNNLTLTGKGIAAHHVEVGVSLDQLTLKNLADGKNVWVNGAPVAAEQALEAGDTLRVGSEELEVVDPKRDTKGSPTVIRTEQSTGWALKANHSALSNRVFAIKTVSVIGRSSECDISLAASHLSRRHAKMFVKDGQLYIKDLDSSNGTFLNGKRITEAKVKRGDELRFDALCFGVIGPANDMDKTSVRSVRKSAPKAAKLPKAGGAPVSSRMASKPKPQVTEHVSNEGEVEERKSVGVIAVSAVVVVVAVVAYLNGLIPLV